MFKKWSGNLSKFNLWLVVALVVLLTIFYFFPSLQNFKFWTQSRNLQREANQLQQDNQGIMELAEQDKIVPVRAIDDNDHSWGDIDAPVQLIVYTDFDCPFCADFSDTVKQLKEEFGEQVVVAYRHYYLPSHQRALATALASECAGEQGKFWEMQDRLFVDYREHNNGAEQIMAEAVSLELDVKKFQACLDQEKYQDKILAQMQEAKSFGVNGTPTSFLNRMILPGAYQLADFSDQTGQSYSGLRSLVEQALAK